MRRVHASTGGASLALGLLTGCGLFDIDPANEISGTEVVSAQVRVVELGPLDPARVTFPSAAPVAEILPGDHVRFEVEVADEQGLALADDRLDSVWLLVGDEPTLLADPTYDQRCDELDDWDMGSTCRLGEGRGGIEFVAPPLAPSVPFGVRAFAVIAWNGQSAEDCWAARRYHEVLPSDCEYISFEAGVGPPWWLAAYAEQQGIAQLFPVERFPAALFLQQANRPPVLEQLVVERGDQTSSLAPVDGVVGPIAVAPGELVRLTLEIDQVEQFGQTVFHMIGPDGDVFTLAPEGVFVRLSTAGPIRVQQYNPIPIDRSNPVEVDGDAPPGIARLVLVLFDDRGAEQVFRVELDVQ